MSAQNLEPQRVLQYWSWEDQSRWQEMPSSARFEWLEFVVMAAWAGVKHRGSEKSIITFNKLETKLQSQTKRLHDEFGVASLAVFGSVARGQERPDSDVDFLVRFGSQPTFDKYMNLKFFLEELLGCPVDLVTQDGVRPQTRRFIEGDARRVA